MVLTVIFATRGALASNRHIIEVLHFVGAESSFVAREFQKHFLIISLKGALAGAVLAALFFGLAAWWQSMSIATPESDQATALFGSFTIDWTGYVGIFITMLVLAIRGTFHSEYYTPVEVTGLYWHFVDIVWVFLFPLLYLVA